MELNEFAVLAIRSVIHGRHEGRDDVTGLAIGWLTRNRTTPAEPSGESVGVTVVVVGTVSQLVAEVLARRLVIETQERSELPISTTRSIAHVVVEDIHGPEVGIRRTTVVVLEASAPRRSRSAVIEVEVDVQTAVRIVHVHHSSLEEGCSIFILRHGHATSGEVLHKVSGLAHVTIDIVELQEGIDTVVKVGVVTCRDYIPRLACTTSGCVLVAAVKLQLRAVNSVELKLGASEGGNIVRCHGSVEFGLTLYRVVSNAACHLQFSATKARISRSEGNHTTEGVDLTAAVKAVGTFKYRVDVSTNQGLDGTVASSIITELENLSVPVGELLSVLQSITETEEHVTREQVTDDLLAQGLQVVASRRPSSVRWKEERTAIRHLRTGGALTPGVIDVS